MDVSSKIKNLESTKGDRNKKHRAHKEAKALRTHLNALVSSSITTGEVDQWILDGVKTWIDTFLPNITTIRVYPDQNHEDEHVFGHLDLKSFSIADSAAFHYTYGAFPTEELTMIGIITSVPTSEADIFSPLKEFEKETLLDNEGIENAFRGLYRGFDGLEAMIRTCRFPRILVHPLLVYREAKPKKLK